MVDEQLQGGGGGSEEAASLSLFLKKITSAARIIISKLALPPPPSLLPVTVRENVDKLEVGKLAFTMGTAATIGLVFSHNFAAAEAHCYVIVGFMAALAILLNGILFGKTSLEMVGISLVLLCFYVLVGSYLPLRFWWPCCLAAAFSLIPFLSLLINPASIITT